MYSAPHGITVRSFIPRLFGAALFAASVLNTTTLFAACSGTSPNIVCNAAGPITLNSQTGTDASPQRASVYPSNNTVSGLTGTITSVQVRLNGLTHTWLHDMDMALVSPTGQVFVFWSDVGTAGNSQGNPITNQTLTISDAASIDLPQGTPTTNTSYRPKNYETLTFSPDNFPSPASLSASVTNSASPVGSATFASRFNGANPNGTWQLYIALDSSSLTDLGSLQSWDLIFATQASSAATTTTVTSSANPVQIPLSGNSTATITATVTSGGNPVTIGTVNFFEGATALATNVAMNGSGQASFTFNTTGVTPPVLAEGIHNLTVNYSGATGFGASTGSLTQTVDRATQITGNVYCNTGKITLPTAINTGASVYPSKIFVTGLSGVTQTVIMDLKGYTIPQSEDTNLLLVSPTGQKFIPFAYISDTTATNGANIKLDDASSNTLANTGAIASGTYRPAYGIFGPGPGFLPATFVSPAPASPYANPAPFGTATFSSTFAGVSPNGTWSLYAVNGGGGGPVGTREITNGWCLTLGTSSDPATTTTPSVSPTPSALSQSATVSALVVNASNSVPVNSQGSVTFKEGNTTLAGPLNLGSLGNASFNKSDFTQGAHFVDAFYSGAPGFFGLSNGQVLHYVDAATTNPSAGRFCNATALTFPNTINLSGSPYPTRINASGMAGVLSKVTVELNGLSHQTPDDLDLMVTGPNGNSLIAFSDVGGLNTVTGLNIVLDGNAGQNLSDSTTLTAGTFRPTDFEVGTDTFAAPAPTTNVFSASAVTLGTAFNNSNPNGIWTLWTKVDGAGVQGGGSLGNGWCVNLTMTPPVLTISKTHSGNFTQGQTGAQYTVTVGSNGPGSTVGTISVIDTVPAGLTVTGMSGSGWTCTVGTRTCTTNAVLAASGSLPPIAVTVNVASNATSPQVNSAAVSGGGATGASVNDSTIINLTSDLTISKTTGSIFQQGGTATYSLIVNNIGAGASTGNYTISDTMPSGLTIVLPVTGSTWDCSLSTTTFVSCVRSTPIPANTGSAPSVAVNVSIASNAPASITNTASVADGGEVNTGNNIGSVTSNVTQLAPDLTITKAAQGGPFQQGGTVTYLITVTNGGNGPATGTITMQDTIPTGLTVTSVSGTDWTCTNAATVSCTRTLAMAASTSSVITLAANIALNAPSSITNTASVLTAGESNSGNNAGVSVISVGAAQTNVTINVPAGISFTFNGSTVTGSQTFQVAPGTYTLSTTTPQIPGAGVRAVFASWSDAGAISHSVTVGSSALTITGNFTTQFQLTTAAGAGGTVTPATGSFFDSGTVVNVTATPNSGFVFSNWTGPVANPNAAATTVTMNAAKSIAVNFVQNVSGQVSVISSGLLFSRPTQRFVGTVTITNTSASTIVGPLQLMLTNLTPGVSLANATGTSGGNPYITSNAPLLPGGSVSIPVQFSNPAVAVINYTPLVLSGGL